MTTKVYGIVAGVPIPYVTPPDACTGCNLNCPLAAGGNFTYINTFPVLKEYPPVCVNLFQALLVFVDLNICRVVSNKCLYLHPNLECGTLTNLMYKYMVPDMPFQIVL